MEVKIAVLIKCKSPEFKGVSKRLKQLTAGFRSKKKVMSRGNSSVREQ